ncbi:two-component-system connector protein SafA [Escherichia coli]|nr:two-component-system connector protein SafA [Escherichia coli]KAF3751106.1 two-component-system connector protein SafA [Escherichia coli]
MINVIRLINTFEMHATIVKNKITQRDNYKGIMSVIVVVLLLTLTLIAIFSAIDQLGISEMGGFVE